MPTNQSINPSRDAYLKQNSFTLNQYFDLVRDMPSIFKDWIPDNRALSASSSLGEILDKHFSGVCLAAESTLASSWHEIKFPLASQEHTNVEHIQDVIGYRFTNERLLYQAFTRRSYGRQIRTYTDYEILEYLGDSVLTFTLNRLMLDQYAHFDTKGNSGNLFSSEMDEGPTRSTARTHAAEDARRYLQENGYWMNIADADIEPQLDLAINQLQELYQKRYIDKAEYDFVRDGRIWYCTCSVGRHSFKKHGYSKPESKKKAAFATLIYLMRASGLYDPDWYRILDDQAPLFLDEVVAFEQEHKEVPATFEEKCRFIVNIQNTYDTDVATKKFEELDDAAEYLNTDGKKHSEYIQETAVAYRNIGISLCEVMKVDYNEFYNWKRNGIGCINI